jgi:translation initiation factor IF-3
MDIESALKIARERELDLVEISPQADPPVCKIMDYRKFKFEQGKKARKASSSSRARKRGRPKNNRRLSPSRKSGCDLR